MSDVVSNLINSSRFKINSKQGHKRHKAEPLLAAPKPTKGTALSNYSQDTVDSMIQHGSGFPANRSALKSKEIYINKN